MRIFISVILALMMPISSVPVGNTQTNDNLDSPFFENPADHDFSKNSELLERIVGSSHGYFRFINIPFSNYMCHYYADILIGQPSLNLHGDAHIEQYAVTDLGRGLTDFDDSSTGPALLDWMRFGVSVHLACEELGWTSAADSMVGRFFRAYRATLENPEMVANEPNIVTKMKAKFTTNRLKYFEWVASIMEPMPDSERDSVLTAMKSYIATQFAEDASLPKNYFQVQEMGYLRMGIGSALDLKYIVRLHGLTDDPMDDVVLEVKQVRDLSGISCVQTSQKTDPFRILLGQARIAYHPFHHLGYFQFRGMNFWVHSWVDNYKELKISSSFTEPHDMAEVVYDVGVQLGRGHIKHIATPLDLQVRRSQLQLLNEQEMRLRTDCGRFAQQVDDAWKQFCDELKHADQ
ncbi:DUF2252 family protein [candidate division KSB1 bacterium]|nr:DUF2252 family protein [candidate division KSB1 bacterium]